MPGAGYVGGEFLKAVAVSIGPHDLNEGSGGLAGGSAGQLRPLSSSSPARLGSHDDRLVSLTFRLDARCPGGQARDLHSGTTTEWVSTLPIRFRVWGVFTRTQDVPLPTNIAIACKGNRIDVTR